MAVCVYVGDSGLVHIALSEKQGEKLYIPAGMTWKRAVNESAAIQTAIYVG